MALRQPLQQQAAGGPDRVAMLLAQALAAPAAPGPAEQAEADRLLHDHAFRLVHNELHEIRREAVAEHLGALKAPPGFWTIAAACFTALLGFGLVLLFLAAHPATFGQLVALMGG